jgi:hypothetical protein
MIKATCTQRKPWVGQGTCEIFCSSLSIVAGEVGISIAELAGVEIAEP